MPFFSDFSLKIHSSYAHILSTKRPFSKNTLLSCPYFVKKHQFSKKHGALISFFSNLSWKTHCCHTHIWSKKTSILSKLHQSWAKKVNRMPFFFQFFTKKLLLLCPYFVKKRPFSKKHTALMPIFCRKNVHPLKNTMLHVICIKFFMKKPLLFMPMFGQECVNSVKTTLYYWLKSQYGTFFSRFYTKKSLLSCPYLVTHCSRAHILSKKRQFSQKDCALM